MNNVPAIGKSPIETIANMASEQEQSPDIPALTARMARGEESAFHEFHKLYFNRVLRYLLVVSNGREEIAREALQLAFVRAARHVRRFESESAFWNWLTVLARSCFVDEIRKQNRHRNLLARFFQQRPVETDFTTPDAGEHFSELLTEEMARLPDEDRELLQRKYFESELVRDIADERQITEKAMESRLSRARQKLKTAILERLKRET
ncbi:MAG TPA: sigma-70 family RNA polymerase sigma factor [Verrucomicrobiae bacterium]|nr:sigma-70 family RNA polymerase sigma factor [Verrucomicrobiae bacterium]